MKIIKFKIALIIISSFFIICLLSSCAPEDIATEESLLESAVTTENTINETVPEETAGNNDPEEIEADDEPGTDETVNEEQLKDELHSLIKDFFDSVKSNSEYYYLSSYTKNVTGSEDDYKNETKSDIYSEIHNNNSSWGNVAVKNILYYKDRALLIVSGNRDIDGNFIEGDEESFRLINEDNTWKIDYLLPVIPLITPLNPKPDSISEFAGLIEIKFEIMSFFPLRNMELTLNDVSYNPDEIIDSKQVKYYRTVIKNIPAYNAYRSLNKIRVEVINNFGDKGTAEWSFVLG